MTTLAEAFAAVGNQVPWQAVYYDARPPDHLTTNEQVDSSSQSGAVMNMQRAPSNCSIVCIGCNPNSTGESWDQVAVAVARF